MEAAIVARKRLFSSAHLYKQTEFSETQNQAEFGLCYGPHGHGHNYVLEAFVAGPIDPHTKLVINLADLDVILEASVRDLEHRHLNFEVPEFKDTVPTCENIALYLRERLDRELSAYPRLRLQRLRLYETDDLWVEVFN